MKVIAFFGLFTLFACSSELHEEYSKNELEKGVNLLVSNSGLSKLKKKRFEAIEQGHLLKSKSDYVPAELVVGKKSVGVKIRLKGDEIDHLSGEDWSLRVKSKKKKLAGHQKFSIQSAASKNYIGELLFHAWCKKEGIISLDYFFLPLSINDSLWGTYAFEAISDNESLKKSGRIKAPILRFEEDEYWKKMVNGEKKIDSICMIEASIQAYNKKWIAKESIREQQFNQAKQLLDDFRKRKIVPKLVFDYELMAKYIAISEVLGSSHNLRWINLRLYYNPESRKLEPIAFDCFDTDDPRTTVIWYKKPQKFEYLLHPLLEDKELVSLVEKHLKTYASEEYISELFNENRLDLTKAIQLLKADKGNYFFSRKALMERAEYLRQSLE